MGNLSQTKKKLLAKGNRKHRKAMQRKQEIVMATATEEGLVPPQTLETMVASYVRYVVHQRPDLMLGWSYPKQARDIPHVTLVNAAGDKMYVYGGSYYNKPEDIAGVKMAMEIDLPCDVDIPTADFNVPDKGDFTMGIQQALELLLKKGEIYVGCMGGIGRTGLAIAGILKLYDKTYVGGMGSPTYYRDRVRRDVNHHAIETKQQLDYLGEYLTN